MIKCNFSLVWQQISGSGKKLSPPTLPPTIRSVLMVNTPNLCVSIHLILFPSVYHNYVRCRKCKVQQYMAYILAPTKTCKNHFSVTPLAILVTSITNIPTVIVTNITNNKNLLLKLVINFQTKYLYNIINIQTN